jgi:glycosyltransferase involved in cell wall biosynthesis
MTEKNPTASIVIRCYNEERYIKKLLDEVFNQSINNFEVIVVDSGSTDATLSIIKEYPVKLVTLKPEKFSFGRALNAGCQEAAGEFLCFLSGHTYPANPNWLKNLLGMFEDPKVALVYGKQRGSSITRYPEHRIFEKHFPDLSVPKQVIPFCNNANAGIRRKLWAKIHYDETLTGLEDIDWAKRAIELGYYIAYNADAEIIHIHNESRSKIFNRYEREAIALKKLFPDEKFGFFEFLRLLVSHIFLDCKSAYNNKSFRKHLGAIILFRSMQMYGTYSGFKFKQTISKEMKMRFYYPARK